MKKSYVLLLQVHQYWRLLVGARERQVYLNLTFLTCMFILAWTILKIENFYLNFYQTGLATARRCEISKRNQGAGRLRPLQGPQVRDLRGLRQLHVCGIPRHPRSSKSGSYIRIQHQSVPFLQIFKFDCLNVTFLWWPQSAAAATMFQAALC